jgi:hypothetical protein
MVSRTGRKLMVVANGPRYLLRGVRQGVASFLAITGLVFVVLGLLYRFAGARVPHLLQQHVQGHLHAGPDRYRSSLFLIAGGASLLVAWLIRPRRS